MKTKLSVAILTIFIPCSLAAAKDSNLYFIENVGQLHDQKMQNRKDIDVSLNGNGLVAFIGKGSIHYQFSSSLSENVNSRENLVISRIEAELVGANLNAACIKQNKQDYYERFYYPWLGEQGAIAYTYTSVLYKDVYPGIDWRLYVKDNKLEYDFIVHEGADPDRIKIKYNGATLQQIESGGSLSSYCPLGVIKEAVPFCYDEDQKNIAANYQLNAGQLSFKIAPYKGKLIIDPQIDWGTYYYGASEDLTVTETICSTPNEVYMCGAANTSCSGLATTGAYQDTVTAGADAYFVKFDSLGNRLWCTYFGGESLSTSEGAQGLAADAAGNVYICGVTYSSTGIATSNSHQPLYGGGVDGDAFLAKFSSSGARIWSTYYGGDSAEYGWNVVVRGSSLYLTGSTNSINAISTNGAHQVTTGGNGDDFLVKFDTSGVRQWATYYGGMNYEGGSVVDVDDNGNAYLAGLTTSANNIATIGCHQPNKEPGREGYLAKFNAQGVRQWATYYGGESDETLYDVAVDGLGNAYISGLSGGWPFGVTPPSSYNIATPGSLQDQPGLKFDGFVAKFDSSGQRKWGTYFGGNGKELMKLHNMSTDIWGNLYFAGTCDTNAIPGLQFALQQSAGGIADAFITKLDSGGALLWSSYFGGSNFDNATSPVPDNIGNMYFCGQTRSDNGIATSGSFISSNIFPGGASLYLVRVKDTAYPLPQEVVAIDQEYKSLKVYPNPGAGIFTVSIEGDTKNLYLYDNAGRLLRIIKVNSRSLTLNIADKAAGIYWLRDDKGRAEKIVLLK